MLAAASFRDPAGCCFSIDDRILRLVAPDSSSELEGFLASASSRKFFERQQLIPSRRLGATEVISLGESPHWKEVTAGREIGLVLEHERVAFCSYPYEWPPEMLFAAGLLTLDLAEASLEENFGLKDATPYNVLFRGCKPVFVDLLSFERRADGDPIWKPYAQFVRTFLLPLIVNRQWGIPLADLFTNHRDGLESETVYRMCSPLQKFLPPFLSLVSMPTWLASKGQANSIYESKPLANEEKARFIVRSLFGRLRRALERFKPGMGKCTDKGCDEGAVKKLKPAHRKSTAWSGYMENHSYTGADFTAKENFVKQVLSEFKPKQVLDVGANTGHFSLLAAAAGARVVAIDSDPACMGSLWQQAFAKDVDVLPLVVDLARPSAALGWRNGECASFLSRATGAFEAVFMLAVVHHLLVTERVPLGQILDLAAELTSDLLVVEFVGPQDEMFRRLSRGRDDLFTGLNAGVFESACRKHFEIVRAESLGKHRRVYLLRKGR